MDARESRFRNATDMVIRSSRTIGRRINLVKPFYLGDPDAPIPPLEDRLETILNPKSNGAYNCIDALCEAAKEYRPGEYPKKHLDWLNKSTLRLISNWIEPILRTPICNKLVTLVKDIHNYLTTPRSDFSMERHVRQLDKFRNLWSTRCCENSDAFYELTSQLLREREASAKAIPPRGKKTRGKAYGSYDKALRQDRNEVVAEMRRRKMAKKLSWNAVMGELHANSAYAARLRGKTDATWIRYAKSGFRDTSQVNPD